MTSNINLALPQELGTKVEEEARRNNLSMEQYLLYLITQVMAYSEAKRELRGRLAVASPASPQDVLNKVPDIPPMEGDEIY